MAKFSMENSNVRVQYWPAIGEIGVIPLWGDDSGLRFFSVKVSPEEAEMVYLALMAWLPQGINAYGAWKIIRRHTVQAKA